MKACLVGIEERGEIDMESCVSWFAIHVCCVGTKLTIQAWNEHTIPGIFTVKPPNKGHIGDGPVVPCREVVLFSEVPIGNF